MNVIGFTGTKEGLTERQSATLFQLMALVGALENDPPTEAVHGGCVGGDATFHAAALALNWRVVVRPGHDADGKSPHRAVLTDVSGSIVFTHAAEPYLIRNPKIVQDSFIMFVCPKERDGQLRSGTWSTFRHAKKLGRLCVVIFPEGDFELR